MFDGVGPARLCRWPTAPRFCRCSSSKSRLLRNQLFHIFSHHFFPPPSTPTPSRPVVEDLPQPPGACDQRRAPSRLMLGGAGEWGFCGELSAKNKKKKLKKQILRGLLMWDHSEVLRTKREGGRREELREVPKTLTFHPNTFLLDVFSHNTCAATLGAASHSETRFTEYDFCFFCLAFCFFSHSLCVSARSF